MSGIDSLKVGLVVILLILVGYIWNAHNKAQQEIGYQKAVSQYTVELIKVQEEARLKEEQFRKDLQEAQNERAQAEHEITRNRESALLAEHRLRIASAEFSKRLSDANKEASLFAAETAAGLLEECSGRYRQVAEAADGHFADLQQCERAWPE